MYILLLWLSPWVSLAQDYSFSQYYLDKLSVSPAFVTVGDYSEVGASVRSQWPGIDGGCGIYMAEGQLKLPGISSGLGARVFGNLEGGGAYSCTGASLIYGYEFPIVYNIKCGLGMEAGWRQSSLSQSGLIYGSMIDRITGQVSQINEYVPAGRQSSLEFGAGMVLYTKLTMMGVGLSRMGHISLSGDEASDMLINAIVNHKIVISANPDREKQFLVPCLCWQHSRAYDMLMPGMYYQDPRIMLSVMYRMQWYSADCITSAVVASVGISVGRLEIGLGHDFETSGLLRHSHGATEVGIKYKF